MIGNDEELTTARQAILNIQKILVAARKKHSAQEYRAMSEPILLELQQRNQEIFQYLSVTEAEAIG